MHKEQCYAQYQGKEWSEDKILGALRIVECYCLDDDELFVTERAQYFLEQDMSTLVNDGKTEPTLEKSWRCTLRNHQRCLIRRHKLETKPRPARHQNFEAVPSSSSGVLDAPAGPSGSNPQHVKNVSPSEAIIVSDSEDEDDGDSTSGDYDSKNDGDVAVAVTNARPKSISMAVRVTHQTLRYDNDEVAEILRRNSEARAGHSALLAAMRPNTTVSTHLHVQMVASAPLAPSSLSSSQPSALKPRQIAAHASMPFKRLRTAEGEVQGIPKKICLAATTTKSKKPSTVAGGASASTKSATMRYDFQDPEVIVISSGDDDEPVFLSTGYQHKQKRFIAGSR
ncbi:hypothetical protein FA95DRAFT_1600903 [Auriscalpium vulgare]|uniref:Uncharacterized protein n=1 Tax=Auriscalpium vulgare TaxID=40419 RepID=A0ACB8SBG5_9AGAM|nr:hypothetical protein FA95DRAFT_1600903 [Auriscalpium vulgare]